MTQLRTTMTQLRTKRLVLRPFQMADVDALFEVFSNPDAMKYWSTLPHASKDDTRKMVEMTMGADPAKHLELAITLKGQVIGKVGLWSIPEIGYLLHPDHWGKGFGSEAAQAVIAHGFETLGLDKITADVDPDNAGSLRMLAKLGFVETGRAQATIKIGDVWYDSIYLALDRSKWKGPPACADGR